MAQVLIETSRHDLTAYSGPPVPWEQLGLRPSRIIGDLEEILADPEIDAVIVAGALVQRPGQLRRALQSERHILCVYPPDDTPDITYEAAMIQSDTGCVLLPIFPWAMHPAVRRMQELLRTNEAKLTGIRLIEWERSSLKKLAIQNLKWDKSGSDFGFRISDFGFGSGYFPGWEVLQALGGPIVEISAFAEQTLRKPDEPLLVAGRFERGGIFQAILSPHAGETNWRLRLTAPSFQAELSLNSPHKATLSWAEEAGATHLEEFQGVNSYQDMVEVFENAITRYEHSSVSEMKTVGDTGPASPVTWWDAIRCAELDDAARRSVERRRAGTLEYPEATEEAGFKGAMTLIGCGMLWLMLLLLLLSRWFPALLGVIVIMLTVFLCLQLLRAIVRKPETGGPNIRIQNANLKLEKTTMEETRKEQGK
jgi:predicted dehydrogenase